MLKHGRVSLACCGLQVVPAWSALQSLAVRYLFPFVPCGGWQVHFIFDDICNGVVMAVAGVVWWHMHAVQAGRCCSGHC